MRPPKLDAEHNHFATPGPLQFRVRPVFASHGLLGGQPVAAERADKIGINRYLGLLPDWEAVGDDFDPVRPRPHRS